MRPGIMPRRLGEIYNRLFLDWQEGVYQPLVSFDKAEVEHLLEGAREFVAWCRKHLGLPPE